MNTYVYAGLEQRAEDVVGIAVHHQLSEPLGGQAQERFEPALQRRHRRRTSAGAKARLYHEVPVCVRGPRHEIVHDERPDAVLELIVMASLEEFLQEDAAAACGMRMPARRRFPGPPVSFSRLRTNVRSGDREEPRSE